MVALMIALMLSTGTPEASEVHEPQVATTAEYIRTLKPTMTERESERLGKIIDFWAVKYAVNPDLMVAMIRLESNFKPGLRACWPAPWKGVNEITCDHGLAQINETWIRRWNLDPVKLVTDDSYNVAVQARILAWIQRYYGEEQDWYARYHSATPSKRAAYDRMLTEVLALR